MNNDQERRRAEIYKQQYPPGTRLELISMSDPSDPVPPGTRGTVWAVDSLGTLHMEFDNGRTLGIVPGEDSFRKLTRDELAAEFEAAKSIESGSTYSGADFQCDETSGFPTVLCYNPVTQKAWLEPNESLISEGDDVTQYYDCCLEWGIRDCASWEDYNRLLRGLSAEAYENAAVFDECESPDMGMTL